MDLPPGAFIHLNGGEIQTFSFKSGQVMDRFGCMCWVGSCSKSPDSFHGEVHSSTLPRVSEPSVPFVCVKWFQSSYKLHHSCNSSYNNFLFLLYDPTLS